MLHPSWAPWKKCHHDLVLVPSPIPFHNSQVKRTKNNNIQTGVKVTRLTERLFLYMGLPNSSRHSMPGPAAIMVDNSPPSSSGFWNQRKHSAGLPKHGQQLSPFSTAGSETKISITSFTKAVMVNSLLWNQSSNGKTYNTRALTKWPIIHHSTTHCREERKKQ